jgi:transposase
LSQSTGDPLTRGDRRRNEKLRVLREAIPPESAVLAIDLAQAKQAAVECGANHELLARRLFACSVWGVDQMIDWALEVAGRHGFTGLTVACEPTGHHWKPVLERVRRRELMLVCIPPVLVRRGREQEDLTSDRSDFKDAAIIGRLARELRGYVASVPEAAWSRLRHLGARREAKLAERTAARLCLRDLLLCYWPGGLEAAKSLNSTTPLACLAVCTDPEETRAMSYEAFSEAVEEKLPHVGAKRKSHKVMRAFYEAVSDPRQLSWERVELQSGQPSPSATWWPQPGRSPRRKKRWSGSWRLLGCLDLAKTIPGLSAVGTAAILAETGDPRRYDSGRTWVKHAGICPRDNESGWFKGKTKVSRRGRPRLRSAAWRVVSAILPHHPVFKCRYQHLITREGNRLTKTQARVAVIGTLLRQLWAVLVHRVAWDPSFATGKEVVAAA